MVSKTRRFRKKQSKVISKVLHSQIGQNQNQNQNQKEKQKQKQRKWIVKSRKNIFKRLFPLTQIGRARLETNHLRPYSKCKSVKLNGQNEVHYVCPPENISLILAKFPAKVLKKLFAIYPIHDFFNEMIIMALASDDEELQLFYKQLIESKLAPLGEQAGEVVSKFLNSLWGGVPILGSIVAVKNAADSVSEAAKMTTGLKGIINDDVLKIQNHIYKNMIALEAFTGGIMAVLGISAPDVIKAFQNTNVFAGLYQAAKEGQFLNAVNNLQFNMVLKKLANNDTKNVNKVIQKIKQLYNKLKQKFPSSIAEKITGSPEKTTSKLQQVPLGVLDTFDEDPKSFNF
jgi:hypothetical protein